MQKYVYVIVFVFFLFVSMEFRVVRFFVDCYYSYFGGIKTTTVM